MCHRSSAVINAIPKPIALSIAVKEREKGGEMLMKPFNGREMCHSKRGTNRTEEASKVNY